MPTFAFYDIEIVKAIPDKGPRLLDIEYCGGWNDHAGMGIAVCVIWNTAMNQIVYFTEGQEKALASYIQGLQVDYIAGHNIETFDHKVLEGQNIRIPDHVQTFDLLREGYKAAGLAPYTPRGTAAHRNFKLRDFALSNGLEDKLEDGAQAPILWQRGEHQRVIDYCVDDVKKVGQLILWLAEHGKLNHPHNHMKPDNPRLLNFNRPWLA